MVSANSPRIFWLQGAETVWPPYSGRHFQMKEKVWTLIIISLKLVSEGPINNMPALDQIIAWCRSGDKPLSKPLMGWFGDAYMRLSASMG